MKKTVLRVIALCLLLALCLGGGAMAFAADDSNTLPGKGGRAKPSSTPRPTTTAAPSTTTTTSSGASAALDEVRSLIDARRYYDAALACKKGMDRYPESKSRFNSLMSEISDACRRNLPASGELERTFQYQGGNILCITARSGHVEMTATDVDNPKLFVRFFIRKGETCEVYLPGGRFKLTFKVGDIWFSDSRGFGELCQNGSYRDYLEFPYTEAGGWITNYRYEDEI